MYTNHAIVSTVPHTGNVDCGFGQCTPALQYLDPLDNSFRRWKTFQTPSGPGLAGILHGSGDMSQGSYSGLRTVRISSEAKHMSVHIPAARNQKAWFPSAPCTEIGAIYQSYQNPDSEYGLWIMT